MNEIDQAVNQALEILTKAGATAVIAFLEPDAQSWTVTATSPNEQADCGKSLLNEAANAVCQASKQEPEAVSR